MVIANTGDDAEVYGVHVSPDPDLVTYWLADEIDERGYGLPVGDQVRVRRDVNAVDLRVVAGVGDDDQIVALVDQPPGELGTARAA